MTMAMPATVSTTPRKDGRPPRSRAAMKSRPLIARPMMIARPGSVFGGIRLTSDIINAVKLRTNARFSTICLHAGQEPDPSTGAIITPIYQTSTYVQEALGQHKGFEYGRTQNPTRLALERNIAAIEGGTAGFAVASGAAARGAVAALHSA